jgi:hypothetical protein
LDDTEPLHYTEDFNKIIALDNTTSDYVNIEGVQENSSAYLEYEINNRITIDDFTEIAIKTISIYRKISNLIGSGIIKPRYRLSKLVFEPKGLKNFFLYSS